MRAAAGVCGLVLIATAATAQETDITTRPSIVVVGRGEAEEMPDRFRVVAEVQGRGRTQVDALRGLAEVQSRLMDRLNRLEGLDDAVLTTEHPSVRPTFDPECGEDRRDRDDCPINGYVAAGGVTLKGAPIARAGDAVSLAAEDGARNARLESVYLGSERDLQARAKQAAFADARRQADALAEAAGQRIGRILRIQEPGGAGVAALSNSAVVDEVVVTASRIRPSVSLDVAPPPARAEARLTVVFEIE